MQVGLRFDSPVTQRWGPAPGLSNNNKGLTGVGQALNKRVAGPVIRLGAGVADGQDSDAGGQEVCHPRTLDCKLSKSAQASRLAAGVRSR